MTEDHGMRSARKDLNEARTALDEIRAKHAEIRGKVNDPFLKVGAVVMVPLPLQMTIGQIGLSDVLADHHGRLWMGHEGALVLIHDEGLHRMGGRLDSRKPLANEAGYTREPSGLTGEPAGGYKSLEELGKEPIEWYSRKPVPPVRAWQYLGEICPPIYKAPTWLTSDPGYQRSGSHFSVLTSAGALAPNPGDWIVMQGTGRRSPQFTLYTDEEFRAAYEPAAIQGRDASWQ